MLRNLIVAGVVLCMLAGCVIVPRGWGHHRHGGYGHGGYHDRHYDRRGGDYRH